MATVRTREPSPSTFSPQRISLVEQARQSWIRKLIDLSRRNNLLYFRPFKTGTLDLATADIESMTAFLRGDQVSTRRLFANGTDESLLGIVREIARRAMANLEEKGLQTLFVALGKATWPAPDGGRPVEAPILLLPTSLQAQGHGSQAFQVRRAGPVQVNLVLLHVLENQFGVKLSEEELIAKVRGDEEGEFFDPDPVYMEIKHRCSAAVQGLALKDFAMLGNFAFQKMAMVKDLQDRKAELVAHDMISAIAGDDDARGMVSAAQSEVDPLALDQVPPDSEFNVLDADSSQQCAIADVLSGQNAVVHGPPGTGKSQTIANLISGLAALGRRVLFVAEKRAALDVVLHRLEEVGLSHLAIDLHGADLSPKRVMQQVAWTLDMVRNATPVQSATVHSQLVERRGRLNRHVVRLHESREPTGKSIYEMQGRLSRLERFTTSSTRWRGAELNRLDPGTAQEIRDLLVEAGGFASLFLRNDPSAWTGANLPDGKAVQQAIDLASSLASKTWPHFLETLHVVLNETRLRFPSSIRAARELTDLVGNVEETLKSYSPHLYNEDIGRILNDLGPGRNGGIQAVWAWCTSNQFRKARSTALNLRQKGKASSAALFTELTKASEESVKWAEMADGESRPSPLAGVDRHLSTLRELFKALANLGAVLSAKRIDECSLDEMGSLVRDLAADLITPYEIPKLCEIEKKLEMAGVGGLVSSIRQTCPAVEHWQDNFDYAWFASTLDAVSQDDPEIRGFKGQTHSRYVEDFTRLDEERLTLAADRVRRAHGLHAVAAMNAHSDQQSLIRAEANKSRRHLPLRKVFAQAAEVLTAVCPCWMASPLAVSQLLDGRKQYFDFVIFDEASQVLPEDAVPAILRGRGVVVAGDNKQLPPTTFFASGDDDDYSQEEQAGKSEGFESLLDMMIPFVRSRYLDWHYRSRDESLINFSNHHIYQGRLVTFPGPGGSPAIDHVLVQQELGIDGQEESSTAEVRKVVELVLEHARKRSTQSLGVITMGIRHMYRIQAALDRELQNHTDLHEFFDPNLNERFFIKNLERVQGDERDAIIISIGYGKDRAGNLPLRFGPLLSEGGRRRLNVAITRARETLAVVSSFSHLDIDMSKIRPGTGVELLRDYLDYAASNGKRLGNAVLTTVPLNDFEADIFDTLTGQGLALVPQVGASHFRIDMVAEHPRKPGRFVLAIECDGASYHSSYTARDRDRLRQQQLENLGWRFHRIWSTDWFLRKEEEIRRTLTAFHEAVEFANKVDEGASVASGGANSQPKAAAGNGRVAQVNASTQARRARPPIPMKPSIAQYRPRELEELIDWIASDGRLRTDEEIISEMVTALGFARRGARIEAALRRAIELSKSRR